MSRLHTTAAAFLLGACTGGTDREDPGNGTRFHEPADGPGCDDLVTLVDDGDDSLGFSGHDMVALAEGVHLATAIYGDVQRTTEITLTLVRSANGDPFAIHDLEVAERTDSDETTLAAPRCEDYLAGAFDLGLATDDGAFDFAMVEVELTMKVALSATVGGTGFEFGELGPWMPSEAQTWDWDRAWISFQATVADAGSSGQIDLSAEQTGDEVARASHTTIFTWPSQ